MIVGYARTSKKDQNLNLQLDSLKSAGCEIIYQEQVSGRIVDRPELNKMIANLRKGDICVVYSLDRLGRTTKQLIDLINDFKEKGIHFKSLSEGTFDTTSAMGQAIFQIVAVIKAMEVNVLRERVLKSLESSRARGIVGGRPAGSYNKVKSSAAANMYQKGITISEILKTLNISRATLYQYLRREGVEFGSFTKQIKGESLVKKGSVLN